MHKKTILIILTILFTIVLIPTAFGMELIYENNVKNHHLALESPDGRFVLTLANYDFQIRDPKTLEIIERIDYENAAFNTAAIDPLRNLIFMAGYDGIFAYDMGGQLISKNQNITAKRVLLSPSGEWLLAINDSRIHILKPDSLEQEYQISENEQIGESFPCDSVHFITSEKITLGADYGRELIQYNIKTKKVEEKQAIPDKILALSEDKSLGLLADGTILSTQNWQKLTTIPKTEAQYFIQGTFHPSKSEVAVNDHGGNLYVIDYKTGNKKQYGSSQNPHVSWNSSGTRLYVTGNGLKVYSNAGEPSLPVLTSFQTAYVIRETPLYLEPSVGSDYHYYIPTNFAVMVDKGADSYNPVFYWSEFPAIVDEQEITLKGFLLRDNIAFTQTTTEEDYDLYEAIIQQRYKEASDWEDMLRNPTSYIGYYTTLSFSVAAASLNLLEPQGVWADLITDDYGRFIIEMPYVEVEEDWERGWGSDDWIDVYITFSHIGEYTNNLGQVFRIPVFRALAVYDGYRFVGP